MSPRKNELRLGTRGSMLALWQANWVKSSLAGYHPGLEVKLVHIKTTGDRVDFPLFEVGGKGLFVKEIEEALLQEEVDLAVHSAKDLPAFVPQGLELMAFPEREDPRDALICARAKSWNELPPGGLVGTGSPRRKAQLLNLRPDLTIIPLRGNLDTRIKKLTTQNLDAIVVASAGLRRLGWQDRASEYLSPEIMLPAIGQGVLAIEARQKDDRARQLIALLDHPPTRIAITAERALLRRLEGGCQVPIAGLAQANGGKVILTGLVAATDGQKIIKGKIEGPAGESERLGHELAQELLEKGAREILLEIPRNG